MNNGYMCWVKGGGRPKKIHATLEIAEREAARLANINPTQNVYVVEIVQVIEATIIREPKVIAPVAKPVVAQKVTLTVTMDNEVAKLLNKTNVKVKTSNTLSLPKKGVVKCI